MRRLILPGTFVILLAAIYFLWQNRFERAPGFPVVQLADLRPNAKSTPGVEWLGPENQPTLRLRTEPGRSAATVTRMDFPAMKPVGLIHLRFKVAARNLKVGKEVWDDGRCVVEWHPVGGGPVWENDPFCSVRHNQHLDVAGLVTRPDQPPGIPALRLENSGAYGDLELSTFEATVVRETAIWKIGRWFLVAAWLAWAFASIHSAGKRRFIRRALAASIWVLMGIYFVVPGPWKAYRSFGTPFQIGKAAITPPAPAKPVQSPVPSVQIPSPPVAVPAPQIPPVKIPAVLKSVGKIPVQGDFTLRLKHYAEKARSLLHIALLFGPTLLIACLVGRNSAWSLGVILALAIETAQFSFGYGFDWVDVFDLACDATGVALALTIHRHLKRFLPPVAAG